MNKLLIAGIITLFAIAGFITAIDSCSNVEPKPTTTALTAEQQSHNVAELRTATRGDIIMIPGEKYIEGIYVVMWVDERKDHTWRICIRSMQNGFLTDILTIDYLAQMNIRVIKTEEPEWGQVLKHYLTAHPDSLTQ